MNKEQIEKILIEIFEEHQNEYVFSKFDSIQSRDSFSKALAEELFNKLNKKCEIKNDIVKSCDNCAYYEGCASILRNPTRVCGDWALEK